MQPRPRIPAPPFGLAFALTAWLAVSLHAHVDAQAAPDRPGDGVDALPGVHEVPFALRSRERLRTRLGLGYGWTEFVLGMDDTHHRLQLDAAVSVTPLPWLSAALQLRGRYDAHSAPRGDWGSGEEVESRVRRSGGSHFA